MASRVSGGGQWDVATGASGAPSLSRGWLMEVEPGKYALVDTRSEATARFAAESAGSNQIVAEDLTDPHNGARTVVENGRLILYVED